MLAVTAFVLLAAGLLLSCRADRAETPDNPPSPGTDTLPSDLRAAVKPAGILEHARRFESIAEEHGGNRAAGTPGYEASADYVADSLRRAGYEVTVQEFEFPESAVARQADLEVPGSQRPTGFALMEGSGSGEVEDPLRPVDVRGSTSGCEMSDFEEFDEGDVALLRRGTCTFRTKAENAERAGASAALIFNAGEAGGEVLRGSLGGSEVGIPVMGTSEDLGEGLLAREGTPEVRVFAGEGGDNHTTNVIAQTRGGNEDETMMIGAHLDSVPQGPGINDNASGSATVLEIALQMARLDAEPRNRVRFAFWGAEEIGLIGSRHYVEGLDEDEIGGISAYLNLDMVASPNFIRMVYEGPDTVEDVFDDYFEDREIAVETNSALDGRSDHGPFQDEGVPTGGLFSGAGGTKTREQSDKFGGEPGEPFDPCYHEACDTVENLDRAVLDQLSDGAAHATAILAQRGGG